MGQEAHEKKTKKEEKDEEVNTVRYTRREKHLYTKAPCLWVGRPPAAILQARAVVAEHEEGARRYRAPLMTQTVAGHSPHFVNTS